MSEIFPEPNDDDIAEFDPLVEGFELSETAEAIMEYDETRQAMLDKVSLLFATPTERSTTIVLDSGGEVIKKFMTCVDTIVRAEDYSHEMKISAVAQLMLDEDKERLELCSKLLEDDESYTISPYKRETILQIVSSAFQDADSSEILINFLGEQMGTGMGLDLEKLVEHIPDKVDDEEEVYLSKKQALIRNLGYEAIDVLKLGLGVAGGMLIARALSKHK